MISQCLNLRHCLKYVFRSLSAVSSGMSEPLLERVRDLEEEVERLKAQLRGREGVGSEVEVGAKVTSRPTPAADHTDRDGGSQKKGKRAGRKREFDFSSHPRRHVALRLAYLGWEYQGFAVQENTDNTVEARLFEALLKTRLIADRQTSNYHRCGRTDKGVSAFSQVISIDVRSNQSAGGLGVTLPVGVDGVGGDPAAAELPYLKMLNRVLPRDIRALVWAPAALGFSARFDCRSRTYRYYFPRGGLDVGLMAEAAKRYEGTHDFRNLCKMDVGNGVLQFQRTILSSSVLPVLPQQTCSGDPYDLFIFEIKGLAFLYHQVRCMMAVLLLVGQKLEAPEIVDHLLDVEANPRKPQYSMAVDYPLVLFDCHFEGLSWQGEPEERSLVLASLQQHWTLTAVKSQILRGMIRGLETSVLSLEVVAPVAQCLLMEGSRPKNYRPLLERPRCESLESRIEHFVKRGRLERGEDEHTGKRSKKSHNSSGPPDVSAPDSSRKEEQQE